MFLLPVTHSYAYEFPIEVFEYVDDAKVVIFIDESDIAETSNWNPFNESPPLSIEKVAKTVFKYIGDKKEFSNMRLEEIELRKIPHHEKQWHYMVKVKTLNNNKAQYHYFVVLMNGKIITALREPESVK